MHTPGEISFDLGFDKQFFASYEQELNSIDIQRVASEALGGILTLQDIEGNSRSYAEIKAETERFFANDFVARDMRLLDALARQYADFCNHNHDLAKSLNEGGLGDIYERGIGGVHEPHRHESQSSDREKDEKKSKKKAKQKRKQRNTRRIGGMLLKSK